jgi:hypothetical protein
LAAQLAGERSMTWCFESLNKRFDHFSCTSLLAPAFFARCPSLVSLEISDEFRGETPDISHVLQTVSRRRSDNSDDQKHTTLLLNRVGKKFDTKGNLKLALPI